MPKPQNLSRSHTLTFKLQGYALQETPFASLRGYFRSNKPSFIAYDPNRGRKRTLLINYRSHADDYRFLWGFKYHRGTGKLDCGLETVIQTVDHSSQESCVDVVQHPALDQTITKLLSAVAQSIHNNVGHISAASVLLSGSRYNYRSLAGFPEEFQDAFKVAAKEKRAFSINSLLVSLVLEELGLTSKHARIGYLAEEVCGGKYCTRPNRA